MYSYLSSHSPTSLYESQINQHHYFPQQQSRFRQPFYFTKSAVQFDKISVNSKKLKQRIKEQQIKKKQAQDWYRYRSYDQNPFHRSNIFYQITPSSQYQSRNANSYPTDFGQPKKQISVQPEQEQRIKTKQSLSSQIFDTSKIYENIKQSETIIKNNPLSQNAKLSKPFSFGTKNSLGDILAHDFINNVSENQNQQNKSYTKSQYPKQSSQSKTYNQNPQIDSYQRNYDAGYPRWGGQSEIKNRVGKQGQNRDQSWIQRIEEVIENPSYSQDQPNNQIDYPSYSAGPLIKNTAASYGSRWPNSYQKQENNQSSYNRTGNMTGSSAPPPETINYHGKIYYRKDVDTGQEYANFI